MLHVPKRRLETLEHVRKALLGAVKLELSTIPAYLTALYSIKPGTNVEIANILRSVVLEEMLHLCLACNILNAVGGHPTINAPGFSPDYPSPLPMGIGAQPGKRFIVPIRRFSRELTRDVFMTLEEPEHPLLFPDRQKSPEERRRYHTIGDFYGDIEQAMRRLGRSIFTGDRKRQVTGWFPNNELFAVKDLRSAIRAMKLIVEQGEGTKTSPIDAEKQMSHFYLFAEIVKGRRLVRAPRAPEGFSYRGTRIPFDRTGVFPMVDNPRLVPLPAGSLAAHRANQFDATYTALLNAVQRTVTGAPRHLDATLGLMYALRVQAQLLMALPIPGMGGRTAGPRWHVVPRLASG